MRALWRRIPYGVTLPDGSQVDIHVGSPALDIDRALRTIDPACRAWALLTAHNPEGRSAPAADNARASLALADVVRAGGWPCLPSSGGRGDDDAWPPEPGLVVGGLDLVAAHTLARQFRQAAFLYARAGAPVALVLVRPPAFSADKSIETVAWVDVDERGRCRMVRPRGRELFFMPGGKKEAAEDDAQALARELAEELGVEVDTSSVVARFVVEERAFGPVEPVVVRMACYGARVRGTPSPSAEIVEQDFVALHELDRVPPAGRAVLRALRDGFQ
jgi:8-oxo-dGTP pyrophosphatase MutT (NUDIX family)